MTLAGAVRPVGGGTFGGDVRIASTGCPCGGPKSPLSEPPESVGAHTKLRFRYYLNGTSKITAQIFDVTDSDNRHVVLKGLPQGKWQFVHVDFAKDGIKNDGKQTPFAAGHKVDDIFFFIDDGELLIDEVVLYDAGEKGK